jgi:hypothetical protein
MNRLALLVPSLCLLVPASFAQWSTPTIVPNVNTTLIEWDPSPTVTGLTLYYSSTQTGDYEIFRATRAAPYGPFGVGTHLTELASTTPDLAPSTRLDELEIFFTSGRPGSLGVDDIWRADRPSTAVPFNTPVPVTELNSTSSEGVACLSFDGLRLYFASARPGGLGSFDIYVAARPNWSSPFGTPTLVVELNSTTSDRDPQISPDELTIFFTSSRAGGQSVDTWMATRLDPRSPFGTPVNITALNSTLADYAPGFAIFHDEIFFASNRPGGPGNYDIHVSRFTGLVSNGIAGPGSTMDLRFSDPTSNGRVYIAASSRGSTPGIPIGARRGSRSARGCCRSTSICSSSSRSAGCLPS